MSLTRCPQCGRVADGRSCFACGYEWPKTGVTAVPPASSSAPPVPAARTGPFASPLAPPRAPTPMAQPAAPQQTGPLTRQGMPHPFAPTPSTSPFASGPPTTSPFTNAPPSPFAQQQQQQHQQQQQQQPFRQPPPPPPPDEIVIDSDISFSLMSDAIPPSAGGLPPPPPGLPPPPMPSFPAPPPGLPPPPMSFAPMPSLGPPPSFGGSRPVGAPSDGGIPSSTLDTIFDGIDISVPTAPAKMSDPAMEAGDFMIDTGPAAPPQPPPMSGDAEWAASSALGADLLAAFNNAGDPATDAVEIPVDDSFGADAFGNDAYGGPGLPPPAPGPDPMVQFSVPLSDRLSTFAQRLRAEGRTDDADLVTEAMALIKLQS